MIFTLRHIHELGCLNRLEEELPGFWVGQIKSLDQFQQLSKAKRQYFKHLPLNSMIFRPNPHQYRVSVCNELFKQGVHFDWVRQHMNHLTYDMTQWYLRKEETDKKAIEYKEKMLIGLVKQDFRLIGKNSYELMARVDEFIRKGNYNIVEGLDKLIADLKRQLPIREKGLGFCMKSSFGVKCPTNEFICAFDKCLNHYTYYKVANLTYQRFLDKQKVIQHNQERGFSRQAENETLHLKELVAKRLIPELEEVRYEIGRQGLQRIREENPNLLEIIDNFDSVAEEVKKWIA